MTLFLDNHEPFSVEKKLEEIGIPVKKIKLEIGDYVFGEVAIERKTISDFLNSIYSRRIYDQLYNLMTNYDKPFLIVIGEYPKYKWRRIGRKRIREPMTKEEKERKKRTINANLATSYLSYNIPFLLVKDEDEFIEFLSLLYFKTEKKDKRLKPVKRKSHSYSEIREDIICCLPFIGRTTAKNVIEKFKTIENISGLEINEWKRIKRIGKTKAKVYIEILKTDKEKKI